MANVHHTSAPHEAAPSNPLSRLHPSRLHAAPGQYEAATLAGITVAIHALARVLANHESFRDVQANCQSVEAGCLPLDAPTAEGLFAALYFLSEQAEGLAQMPEAAQRDPGDAPY